MEADKMDQRKRFLKKPLWAGAVLILLASGVVSFLLLESVEMDLHVAVTAHRGSSHNAPENTLAALERAVQDGADYAEIDVQETADGVIAVIHDTDLMRIAGVNKKIWNVTYEEIEGLDAGSWFSAEFKEERIPTLEEMIDSAKGRIKLNIELKLTGHEKNLVPTVLRIIQGRGYKTSCFISSLDAEVLRKVRELDPSMRLGQIVFRAIGQLTRIEKDILCLHSGIATRNMIASAQKKGKEVHVWTVNDPKQMGHFMDLGVDNILTDVPDVLVALREERKEMTDVERFLLAARLWF
jgi:glycerophosphoryl diester phosphodiesterase